ncbi:hypothetical protein ACJIZ3_024140 [Penstemon smallii]|uniref:Uncharacterized protein n=1 Tax=Penstemon smallii TaxID=265156 RepID=A0ABD3TR20_9LAMI
MMWCMRLHSALRTALACAIVGGTTLYGPDFLVSQVKFVAFSYLTAILIVSDATLGDTLRGCWHALCATAQVVPLAMLARWFVDPKAGLPVGLAALAVAVASFLVALPESTHITAKRIAFGQIVIVCSDAVISSSDGTLAGYMHPLHVAASTGLGALASVLPMLLPCPGLAYYKVGKLCRIYAENASERMNLYFRAFKSNDNRTKLELISEAKPVAETGTKLMQSIRILQEGMKWERPWRLFSKPDLLGPSDRLQSMELPMRGIEYSLVSSHASPVQVIDQEQISDLLDKVSIQLQQKIEQATCILPTNSTKPEPREEPIELNPFLPFEPSFRPLDNNGWVFFFFSCADMLLNDSLETRKTTNELQKGCGKTEFDIMGTFKTWIMKLKTNGRLKFAIKCSLSLGLAMLLGLIFDKENGCWAGLTIAISFVTGKQAVFTIANTRAQGTAIGSAYGVICCFLLHYAELRLLALLPWIIFTSFLRHSQMYGQTGGVSAAIGALLILGRKKYGSPNEFAIARLTEVFIGLSCFIAVELFLQPTRAATLAKNHLYTTLSSLEDCVKQKGLCTNRADPEFLELRDKQRHLNSLVCELKKYVTDAEMEPDFWYLPFRSSCYQKLVSSLSNIVDMLHFMTFNLEKVSKSPKSFTTARNDLQEHMNTELGLFQQALSSSLKHLQKSNSSESRAESQEPMDLEMGKLQNTEQVNISIKEDGEEDNEDKKKQSMVRYIAALGYIISSLRKEIDEIEICIKEIVRWENHSSK